MGGITLREGLEFYEDIYIASRNFSQRTRVEYINDLENLIRFLEQLDIKRVEQLSLQHLERYLAELDHRGIAGSTRKRKVVAIRSFLWYLYQDRYLRTNIGRQLIPPLAEAKSPKYLTESECKRLLDVSAGHTRDFAIIQTLLRTGIKLSELTSLAVNDVEPPIGPSKIRRSGYLHVRASERKKARLVPLNSEACFALSAYIGSRPSAISPALFINRFGSPLSPRGVEKIIMKYLDSAGISNLNVQSLRHTFAIRQLAQGMDTAIVQKWLGYEDARSMSSYIALVGGQR